MVSWASPLHSVGFHASPCSSQEWLLAWFKVGDRISAIFLSLAQKRPEKIQSQNRVYTQYVRSTKLTLRTRTASITYSPII